MIWIDSKHWSTLIATEPDLEGLKEQWRAKTGMDADRMLDEEEEQALESTKLGPRGHRTCSLRFKEEGQTNIKTVHGKDGGEKMNKSSNIVQRGLRMVSNKT